MVEIKEEVVAQEIVFPAWRSLEMVGRMVERPFASMLMTQRMRPRTAITMRSRERGRKFSWLCSIFFGGDWAAIVVVGSPSLARVSAIASCLLLSMDLSDFGSKCVV